jgi:CHAT domain-containing protein/tetratricopeptide (TPR) repeat protein
VTATAPAATLVRRVELLTRLCGLKDKAAQARFLDKHPGLVDADAVSWLTNSVREQAKVNTSRAIVCAELSVLIARKLGDPTAIAQSQRAMGNALYLSGQNKAAVKSHEVARKLFLKLGDSTELARTLSASIQPMILTGEYARAFSTAEKARQILRAEGNDWRLARLDLNAGNIFQRQGQFSEALEYYHRARLYFLKNPEKDPEGLGVAMHNVATCLLCLNDFPGALGTYEDARLFASKHGMHVLVGQANYNIALLHYFRGEFSRAVEILRAALETFHQQSDHYHVALCCLDLSEIYLGVNRGKQAEEMAQQAAQDFQQLEMDHEAGKSLTNLALAMWQQGKAEPALELFAKARKAFVDEGNQIWPSRIDLHQAIIFIEQDRCAEAQPLCLAALKVFQSSHIPHSIVLCRLLLSQLSLKTGKSDSARRHCGAALKLLRDLDVPALKCQANHLMGRIHAAARRPKQAYGCYQQACQILEALRSGLNREELKTSFMKSGQDIYEGLVEICLDRARSQTSLEEAFECIEQSKSRSLRDLMFKSGSEFHLAPNVDADIRSKVRDLRAELHWQSRRHEEEQHRGPETSTRRLAQIQNEIRRREAELLRVVREMPTLMAESAGLASSKAVTIDEVRSKMAPESTLLEYFQLRDRFVVLVLRHDLIEIVPVGDVSKVSDLLRRLQFQFSKFRLAPEYISTFATSLIETTQRHLKELYDELLGPIKKWLTGHHLLIVPHGVLHSLPFQALFDGDQYLIDSFSVSYAPSATIFSLCHDRISSASASALAFGIPDAAASFVLDEAKAVAAATPGCDLFLGESATASVLQERGKHSRFIHIATHGYFRQDDPMFSGIRLGDGLLSLYDLYQLELPAELITLSGCATGLNVVADGDELLGLVRGLIYAGAQAALLTLWDVQDQSTSQFMTAFYDHWARCGDKSAALRLAALDLRADYPHPYYWAPFVLVGKVTSK